MGNGKYGMSFLFVIISMVIFSISCNETKTGMVIEGGKVEIMPVNDVRPGMTGYGLTVYQGALPEKFFFKVLGVKKILIGAASGSPVIVAQLTAGPKDFPPEKTGVVSGMSGSPMYIDGKLIGALAYSFTSFAKDPICGIQPAEIMLNHRSEVKNISLTTIFNNKNIPLVLSVPTGMTDFFSKTNRLNNSFLNKKNFSIQPAVGVSVDIAANKGLQLQPGSSLEVYLVKGDITLSATGTVTMVQDEKIYAFGHPFLGIGEVALPFHQNGIITINSSYYHSSKMAGSAVGKVEGTITNDYYSAVSGRIGKTPRMIAVRIKLESPLGSRTINIELIKSRDMTVYLMGNFIPEIIQGGFNEIGFTSLGTKKKVETTTEIVFNKDAPPLVMKKIFDATHNVSRTIGSYSYWLESILVILENKNLLSAVADINIAITITEVDEKNNDPAKLDKSAFLEMNNISVRDLDFNGAAIPGKIFDVDVSLSAKKGDKVIKYTVSMPVPIPENIMLGDKKITMSVGSGFEIFDSTDVSGMNFKEVVAYFNNLFRPGLFLVVKYRLEKEENTKEIKKDEEIEFRNLGSSLVKKVISVKSRKIIYIVPLPAVFNHQAEFKGKKDKSVDVKKNNDEKDDKDKKNDVKKNKIKKEKIEPNKNKWVSSNPV